MPTMAIAQEICIARHRQTAQPGAIAYRLRCRAAASFFLASLQPSFTTVFVAKMPVSK